MAVRGNYDLRSSGSSHLVSYPDMLRMETLTNLLSQSLLDHKKIWNTAFEIKDDLEFQSSVIKIWQEPKKEEDVYQFLMELCHRAASGIDDKRVQTSFDMLWSSQVMDSCFKMKVTLDACVKICTSLDQLVLCKMVKNLKSPNWPESEKMMMDQRLWYAMIEGQIVTLMKFIHGEDDQSVDKKEIFT